jgi:glycerophosphoryl diester phosphodiesterase
VTVRGDRPGPAALVVAHRGAWRPAPQNSLAAFEQAIRDGADAVELDVRRTGDGRLVVVHDPRIGLRAVSALSAAELRARMAPGQAPELEEVLAVLAGRIRLDIELKEDGYVPRVMATIAEHLSPDGYVVTSFLDAVLPQVRFAVPEARTGLLLTSRRRGRALERAVRRAGVSFVAPHLSAARSGLLAWAARHDLPAWVWTVNEPRTVRLLLADPRVGAVITDRCAESVAAAAQLRARAPRAA